MMIKRRGVNASQSSSQAQNAIQHMSKKGYSKLVVIHPHSYMSRWLVRALGADPLRIPITRWNGCLGLALLPVPLALLLRPLGLFAESLGLELVPVPFNVLQSAKEKISQEYTGRETGGT